MADDKTQVVSLRLSDDDYGKLKKYAEDHGQSVGDAAKKVLEDFLGGNSSVPMPQPLPGTPEDIAELKESVKKLKEYDENMMKYAGDMSWRLNEVQGVLNRVSMLLSPYMMPPPPVFPQFPPPSWGLLGAAGNVEGLGNDGAGGNPV